MSRWLWLVAAHALDENADDLGHDLLVVETLFIELHTGSDHAQKDLRVHMQMPYLEGTRLGAVTQYLSDLIHQGRTSSFPFGLEPSTPTLSLIAIHETKEETVTAQIADDATHRLLQSFDGVAGGIRIVQTFDEDIKPFHNDGEVERLLVLEVAIEGSLADASLGGDVVS